MGNDVSKQRFLSDRRMTHDDKDNRMPVMLTIEKKTLDCKLWSSKCQK